MKSSLAFAMAAALGLSHPLQPAEAAAPVENVAPVTANPFFAPSTLPYQLPPFDRIRDEHFLPAFERGMQEQLAEIEAIASNKEAATFENTIVALDRSGQTLTRVGNVFFNLTGADTNDTREKIQTEMAP